MQRLPAFVERVLELVEQVPAGHVVTYGQLAGLAGSRGARTVGTVLSRYGSDVPWWRVVRAGGHPPRGLETAAREHYVREGTALVHLVAGQYRVDLHRSRWDPDDSRR